MSHKKMQLLVSSYVDGEIGADEERKVLEHLNVCSECRQFVEKAGEIKKEIKALREIELPYAFSERVASIARQSDEKAKDWFCVESLARNTFIVIAAAVFVLFFLTGFDKDVSPSISEVLIGGSNGDSAVTQVLLQPGTLSKNDLLFAVMTK